MNSRTRYSISQFALLGKRVAIIKAVISNQGKAKNFWSSIPFLHFPLRSNCVQMQWKRCYLCNRSCWNWTYQTKSLPPASTRQEEHCACIPLLDLGQGHSLASWRVATAPWAHWQGPAHLEQASCLPRPLGTTVQSMAFSPGSGMHLKLKIPFHRDTLKTAACLIWLPPGPCKAEKKHARERNEYVIFYVLLVLLLCLYTYDNVAHTHCKLVYSTVKSRSSLWKRTMILIARAYFLAFHKFPCNKAPAGIKQVHKTENIPSWREANAKHHWQPNWPLNWFWLQTRARAGESTEQQMTCTLDCTVPDACCHVSVPIELMQSTNLSRKASMSGCWAPNHSPPTPACWNRSPVGSSFTMNCIGHTDTFEDL